MKNQKKIKNLKNISKKQLTKVKGGIDVMGVDAIEKVEIAVEKIERAK